ncbi:RNA-binding protein [Salibacteraceae bacterium]|jgi:RNA recognition motif-containing protein|nr:RNA-binding protein [Salibacteraceae bacterium]
MKLFIAKLDYGVDSDSLQTVFEEYGSVSSCNVVMDRETGRSKGFGFVEMENDEEATNAMNELDGSSIRGREIVVKQAEEKPRAKRW